MWHVFMAHGVFLVDDHIELHKSWYSLRLSRVLFHTFKLINIKFIINTNVRVVVGGNACGVASAKLSQ